MVHLLDKASWQKAHDAESDDGHIRRASSRDGFDRFMTHRAGSAFNKLEISKLKAQDERVDNFMSKILNDARSRRRALKT